MQSIEIIRLRTGDKKQQNAMQWLLETVPTLVELSCLKEAVICHGLSAPSDLILFLRWDEVELQARGSDVAIAVSEGLSAFGLVNYTIWSIARIVAPGSNSINQFQEMCLKVNEQPDSATAIREKRKP